MSTEEELTKQIADLGEQIKQAKADKKPKEEWDPILKEMLALKVNSLDQVIVWFSHKVCAKISNLYIFFRCVSFIFIHYRPSSRK